MSQAIAVSKISKKYGKNVALKEVSFKVNEGSIFGFLGPNGAGKTTTIRCLMDYMAVDGGKIEILGSELSLKKDSIRSQIGYLPSTDSLYSTWKVKQHLNFAARLRQLKPDYSIAAKLDLNLDSKVSSLSSGNRQKLLIALALTGKPKLLILDEPTRGLDPILQNVLYDLLLEHKKDGGTVFMSSHNLPEVERVCDSVAVIKEGQIIVEETIDSIRRKSVHLINVTFSGKVDEFIFDGLNVDIISRHDHSFSLKLKGDINPLINVIQAHKITDLTIDHASLEEVFMEIYK